MSQILSPNHHHHMSISTSTSPRSFSNPLSPNAFELCGTPSPRHYPLKRPRSPDFTRNYNSIDKSSSHDGFRTALNSDTTSAAYRCSISATAVAPAESRTKRLKSKSVDASIFYTSGSGFAVKPECLPSQLYSIPQLLVLFTNDSSSDYAVRLVSHSTNSAIRNFTCIVTPEGPGPGAATLAVAPAATTPFGLPLLYDPVGQVASACRVLDPVGGGRRPMRSIACIQNGRVRAIIPLDLVPEDQLTDLLEDLIIITRQQESV